MGVGLELGLGLEMDRVSIRAAVMGTHQSNMHIAHDHSILALVFFNEHCRLLLTNINVYLMV